MGFKSWGFQASEKLTMSCLATSREKPNEAAEEKGQESAVPKTPPNQIRHDV